MPDAVLDDISHRRYNPLRDSWILVSPHRTKRPWQGAQEPAAGTTLPEYDPKCYLCPGNTRASGDKNPQYESTFVFVNDYSAVKEEQQDYRPQTANDDLASTLLKAAAVTGKCYVLTFSKAHNLTLADLQPKDIEVVINAWTAIYRSHLASDSPLLKGLDEAKLPTVTFDLPSSKAQYKYMQIFENKGSAMGCSNPHPHGQIWTTTGLPEEPAHEMKNLQKYRADHDGAHMLVNYANLEIAKGERIVFQNATFIALCPWWGVWPFEVMVLPKQHKRALTDLTAKDRQDLSEVIAEVTRRYDNLFETHFPYSMGIHQAPLTGTQEEVEASSLHLHFYPPLLRSATVKKFLVGYELMAEPQRDITPEQAAARLRDCGGPLYRTKLEEKAS